MRGGRDGRRAGQVLPKVALAAVAGGATWGAAAIDHRSTRGQVDRSGAEADRDPVRAGLHLLGVHDLDRLEGRSGQCRGGQQRDRAAGTAAVLRMTDLLGAESWSNSPNRAPRNPATAPTAVPTAVITSTVCGTRCERPGPGREAVRATPTTAPIAPSASASQLIAC
jgi:hypothetical protein